MDDEYILQTCASDKERGFLLLMQKFREPIYWQIRRIVVSHSDAEDVFQDVWVNVYKYLASFKGASSLKTWIYKIAINESIRFLKSTAAHKLTDNDQSETLLSMLESSDYVDYENEAILKFQKALLLLPEKQRIVFDLRYYEELSYEEISDITGSSVQTLKTNYHYAKEKVKNYIING